MHPTTSAAPTEEPARRAPARALITIAVVATSALSAAFAYGGIVFGALSGLCYGNGPSRSADACATDAWALSATFVATVAIPLGIGLWASRACDTRRTIGRIAACLAGYLLPVVTFLGSL